MNTKYIVMALLALSVYLPLTSAGCFVNGEEVPCDDFFATFGSMFIVIIIVAIIAGIFWLWMLIDCAKRNFDSKLVWILLLIFTGTLGAILYFFLVKRKNVQSVAAPVQPAQ